jgi:hypothetical protein
MASAYPLPDVLKIKEVLGLLFDGLDVKPGGTFDRGAASGAYFGVFVADNGVPVALCGADINLAAGFGAAFSLLPPGAAKDAAKAKELTAVMADNLREIMNICTRLVMSESSPHLKLDQLYAAKSLPPAASALLVPRNAHCEFQLQMPRYGGGVLSLLSA